MNWGRQTHYMGFYAKTVHYPMPAYGNTTKKSARIRQTTEKQLENNKNYAEKMFQSKVFANFRAGVDIFLTLTHKSKASEAFARKAIKAMLRFFRDYLKKQDLKFKYMLLTEKQGEWHHHLIMSGIPFEVIKAKWEELGGGRVTLSPLKDDNGYFDLVNYLFEDEKPSRKENPTAEEKINAKRPLKKNEKRWTCSQGLKVPKDRVTVSKNPPPKKPVPPLGYEIVEGTYRVFESPCGDIVVFESQWVGGGLPKYYENRQKRLASGVEDKYIPVKRKSKKKRE